MLITKNGVKNLVFEFILQDYNNKAVYGNRPTTLEHFYNNWLVRRLSKTGILEEGEPVDQLKKKYENRFLDITWQALDELMRDGLIKRWLSSPEDINRWDVYVPTEKGLETWEKYGRLLIIPSNLTDSLREDIPQLSPDTEMVLDFINEAVYCFFHNLLLGCSHCLASAGRRTILSFYESFSRYISDSRWQVQYEGAENDVRRAELIKIRMNELLLSGALVEDCRKAFPGTELDLEEEVRSLTRSLDFMGSIISITQDARGNPSSGIQKIDETYRQELMLGYLVGSYTFFRLSFQIKNTLDLILSGR